MSATGRFVYLLWNKRASLGPSRKQSSEVVSETNGRIPPSCLVQMPGPLHGDIPAAGSSFITLYNETLSPFYRSGPPSSLRTHGCVSKLFVLTRDFETRGRRTSQAMFAGTTALHLRHHVARDFSRTRASRKVARKRALTRLRELRTSHSAR